MTPDLDGRHLLIGITGGIAVYKMATVVSRLVQRGATVTVAMTPSATRFVAPLTFEALSGRAVYTSAFEHVEFHDPQHVALGRAIDAMLIGPATQDAVARLAHGRADDIVTLLVSVIDRRETPVLVAPSMNEVMWSQPATRRNLDILRGDGFQVIDPDSGWQACRAVGPGRLPEPDDLVTALVAAITPA